MKTVTSEKRRPGNGIGEDFTIVWVSYLWANLANSEEYLN